MPDFKLFDKNHRYTEVASRIDRDFEEVLKPVFQRYLDEGHSPRELQYLLCQVAIDLAMWPVLESRN